MTAASQLSQIFEGRTVWIVAGGPSLLGFDFAQLDGKETLAINRAHEVLPRARMLWWSDALYWRREREKLMAHPAMVKATLQLLYNPDDELDPSVWVFHCSGMAGYDERHGFVRHGNNSGFAALHVAAGLGARRIVLLGVDMKHGKRGRSHWHDGYNRTLAPVTFERVMAPQFGTLVKPLRKLGVEVVNASAESTLPHWPRMTPAAALERYGDEP